MDRYVMTPAEAAEYVAIGENKIRVLIHAGEIPAVHTGKGWRIPKPLLEEWINKKAIGGERI